MIKKRKLSEEEEMQQRISIAINMDHMIENLILKNDQSNKQDPYGLLKMKKIDICRLRVCLSRIRQEGSLLTLRPEGDVKQILQKTELYVF